MSITITDEMRIRAKLEAQKRNPNIIHHFELSYFSGEQRDEIGFLGEFACCKFLGIDWEKNIRKDYHEIDRGDIFINGKTFDVKTETLENTNGTFDKVFNRKIGDNERYGRRLIEENQVPLLKKYDFVIFGAMIRERLDKWYCLGFLSTEYILENYEVQAQAPHGALYPAPALAIRLSDLRSSNELVREYHQ